MAQTFYITHDLGAPNTLPKSINWTDMINIDGSNLVNFKATPFVSNIKAIAKNSAGTILDEVNIYDTAVSISAITLNKGIFISAPGTTISANITVVGNPVSSPSEITAGQMEDWWRRMASDELPDDSDDSKTKYTRAQVQMFFNLAQDRLLTLVKHTAFANKLWFFDPAIDLDDDNGFFDIEDDLSRTTYNNDVGVKHIRITDSEYKFVYKKSFEFYRQLSNRIKVDYKDSSTTRYYIYNTIGTRIFIRPFESDTQVDVWGMKQPSKILLTGDSTTETDCEFDREFTEAILGLSIEHLVGLKGSNMIPTPEAHGQVKRAYSIIKLKNEQYVDDETWKYGEYNIGGLMNAVKRGGFDSLQGFLTDNSFRR